MAVKKIKGLDSLMIKLAELGGDVDEALARATRTVTIKAKADATAAAPVNKNKQSRTDEAPLRGSIGHKIDKQNGLTVGRVVVNNPHAAFVEFGTGRRGAASPSPPKWDGRIVYTETRPRKDGSGDAPYMGMPAQPYLAPTAQINRDVYEALARQELLTAIRKAAKGGRR